MLNCLEWNDPQHTRMTSSIGGHTNGPIWDDGGQGNVIRWGLRFYCCIFVFGMEKRSGTVYISLGLWDEVYWSWLIQRGRVNYS